MRLVCKWCDWAFTATRHKECCSTECAQNLRLKRRGSARWEPEMDFWLEEKVGTMPITLLAAAYNRTAVQRGWPKRSNDAIAARLKRLGCSMRAVDGIMQRHVLSRELGIKYDRVRFWCRRGLPYTKLSRNMVVIDLKDLRRFLLEQPQWATGIARDRLVWAIGEAAADTVLACDHNIQGFKRPVRCVDTGEVYPTLRAASEAHFISRAQIGRAAHGHHKTAAGKRWEFVDVA